MIKPVGYFPDWATPRTPESEGDEDDKNTGYVGNSRENTELRKRKRRLSTEDYSPTTKRIANMMQQLDILFQEHLVLKRRRLQDDTI